LYRQQLAYLQLCRWIGQAGQGELHLIEQLVALLTVYKLDLRSLLHLEGHDLGEALAEVSVRRIG